MKIVKKPWGTYQNILDSESCKVKKIVVDPQHRPSYQYHHKRSEHWIIISGDALVTIDDKEKKYYSGEYVFVPIASKHRIQNIGSDELIFIEVQTGKYFGEDDIVRLEDDYNRSNEI